MAALRVLLVEDEAIIGMLLADLIDEMGHTVCALVRTEAEAVAAAALHRPDVMIVDAGLGRGSGVAAVAEILRAGYIPHIFVSGGRFDDETLDPRAVVLLKPFLEADLARAITRATASVADSVTR